VPAYVGTLVFCTEAQVFAGGGHTWTATSTPNVDQVYQFAQWAAGQITLATDKAGSRCAPPSSGISDVALRNVLESANATGAAYRAWRTMAKGGDAFAVDMRDQLREDWLGFIGFYNDSGEFVPGQIHGALAAAANIPAVRTDETDGFTQFPATGEAITLGRLHAESDVD